MKRKFGKSNFPKPAQRIVKSTREAMNPDYVDQISNEVIDIWNREVKDDADPLSLMLAGIMSLLSLMNTAPADRPFEFELLYVALRDCGKSIIDDQIKQPIKGPILRPKDKKK